MNERIDGWTVWSCHFGSSSTKKKFVIWQQSVRIKWFDIDYITYKQILQNGRQKIVCVFIFFYNLDMNHFSKSIWPFPSSFLWPPISFHVHFGGINCDDETQTTLNNWVCISNGKQFDFDDLIVTVCDECARIIHTVNGKYIYQTGVTVSLNA